MRITLDTNVLVSAFISKVGYSARVLDLSLTLEDMDLILSDAIIREFTRVMSRDELLSRFDYTLDEVEVMARLLRKSGRVVKIKSNFTPVKADAADNIILNTAYDGGCDFIVSGDHHLLYLKRFRGIPIIPPRLMYNLLSRRFGRPFVRKALR
jgi:hypothetical protein